MSGVPRQGDAGVDWQAAYLGGTTPWDLRGVTAPLVRLAAGAFFADLGIGPGSRVAVPGCGRGHDLKVFAELGCDTTGFDISPAAIAEAEELLRLNRAKATLLARDVLGVADEFPGRFDLVYDYTCLCAVAPHLRRAYTGQMAAIVRDGGHLLLLSFPMKPEHAGAPGRPPFQLTDEGIAGAMDGRFVMLESFDAEDSPPERLGAERWYLFRKEG